VERLAAVEEFLAQAGPFLVKDEALNNLVLGIAGTIDADRSVYPEHAFWLVRDGDTVVGAALRTPPHNLALGMMSDAAVAALAEAVLDEELPGVVGLRPQVDEFAHRCSRASRLQVEQGVFALERVADVPRPGQRRMAEERDRELLVDWWRAFIEEALTVGGIERGGEEQAVDRRLRAADYTGIDVWVDDGQIVSFAGWGAPTPNGIRIGPVYTPPELRGRGYATALVADLSQRLLDGGRRYCFLYTNLANPTANAIYQRIGYRRVGESAMYAFL
jgi:predicted GNAT family acetyltransferase